ncbi:MAG: hypothetical protein LC799_04225, partial [Actinobacteria bacterium]|nr:hypothetical protein [Actinomycetota bacterium]
MTTGNDSGNELIDQAFFSFNQVDGLTIVASSLLNDDLERKWNALLRNHVRLKAHKDIPPHAMSYFLISPESAVVLRRVRHGDSGGRNNSHALMSSPQVLTAQVALGLELWTGWKKDPPTDRKMSQLHTSQLNCEVDPAAEFRAQVKKNPRNLEQ